MGLRFLAGDRSFLGQTPKYLIRDNDRKFGSHFARVATTSGIKVLRTPYQTPRANAVSERFLGSVRRECLDHFLIFHEKHLVNWVNLRTKVSVDSYVSEDSPKLFAGEGSDTISTI